MHVVCAALDEKRKTFLLEEREDLSLSFSASAMVISGVVVGFWKRSSSRRLQNIHQRELFPLLSAALCSLSHPPSVYLMFRAIASIRRHATKRERKRDSRRNGGNVCLVLHVLGYVVCYMYRERGSRRHRTRPMPLPRQPRCGGNFPSAVILSLLSLYVCVHVCVYDAESVDTSRSLAFVLCRWLGTSRPLLAFLLNAALCVCANSPIRSPGCGQ